MPVLPLVFDDRLELIVDPQLLAHRELFFSAARLDQSVTLRSAEYARIAKPRIERLAAAATRASCFGES